MSSFLSSAVKLFEYYKSLGDKTLNQLSDEQIFVKFGPESNSIAIIIQHMSGNMLSRWTEFRVQDGEKEWRNRDGEFLEVIKSRKDILQEWEKGWTCLFKALDELSDDDLNDVIYIRNEGHTILEAIHRQLAHYPYHIGQIVFIGKEILGHNWQSLSIPRNTSQAFNNEKFTNKKSVRHFTENK